MDLSQLQQRFRAIESAFRLEPKQKRTLELGRLIEDPNFWSDQSRAAQVQKEKVSLDKEVTRFLHARQSIQDLRELIELASGDESELQELEPEYKRFEKEVHDLEIERMLSGPNDKNSAILSVNAGQGGVDSQDFAEMLLRMYTRYAERRGYKVELDDITPGEEAGIKSATMTVSGEHAYGYLKAEIGVHRLVRISPFDSNARRHTSFAAVWVIPEIDDSFEVDIKPDDLRIDTYRAGGAGGQHVNKTDSAVRITHLPTNIAVACQAERSQLKNKSKAMKILKSRLYDLEMKKRLADKDKAEAEKLEASWGSQIRNYVLAPYRLAKDLRTSYEVGNVDAVLDGEIQPFIESYLMQTSSS
ncbi:MAG: peptide chain release factor 2 [Deltaproteobacteria bacterium]|nr:peptide chain release factor 2 [Deltaproteobacteria bacterium]